MKYVIGLLTFAMVCNTNADPMNWATFQKFLKMRTDNQNVYLYLPPNEQRPQDIQEILKVMAPGTALSVGTERGFIAAGMNDNIQSLDLIDSTRDVVFYNLINWALFKLSRSHQDYLKLRFEQNHSEWMIRLQDSRNPWLQSLLGSVEHFEFWKRSMAAIQERSRFHIRPQEVFQFYAGANYLFHEDQYLRIKALVDRDAVRISNFNLSDGPVLQTHLKEHFASGGSYGLVDISNAWQDRYGYLKAGGTVELLKAVQAYSSRDTIFLVTLQRHEEHRKFPREEPGAEVDWRYLGFTFSYIDRFGGPELFVRRQLSPYYEDHDFSYESTLNGEEGVRQVNLHSEPLQCRRLLLRPLIFAK